MPGENLIRKRLFLAYSFDPKTKHRSSWIQYHVKPILASCGFEVHDGAELAAEKSLAEGIKQRVASCDVLLCFLTKRHKIQNKHRWTISHWALQEAIYAEAQGKKVVVIAEKDVEFDGGLLGDKQIMYFHFNNPLSVFSQMLHAVRKAAGLDDGLVALQLRQISKYGGVTGGVEWWDWWIWLDGSPATLASVASVTYKLHSDYAMPTRFTEERSEGFGESDWTEDVFTVKAIVRFKDGERKELKHRLTLV